MFDNPLLPEVKQLLDDNNYLTKTYSDYDNDICELKIPNYGSIIYKALRNKNLIKIDSSVSFHINAVPEYAITPVVIADIEQKLLLNYLYSLDALACYDLSNNPIEITRLFKQSKNNEINEKEEILLELSFNLKDESINELAEKFDVLEGLNIIRGILLEK